MKFIFKHAVIYSKCIKALINKKDNCALLLIGGLIVILCE